MKSLKKISEPVTDAKNEGRRARLKVNMIVEGVHYPLGSVVDVAIIPERFRMQEYMVDLGDRDGLVLLLTDVHYQQEQRSEDGHMVGYPTTLAAGQLCDLSKLPKAARESLKLGVHFVDHWDERARQEEISDKYRPGPDTDWDEMTRIRVRNVTR